VSRGAVDITVPADLVLVSVGIFLNNPIPRHS